MSAAHWYQIGRPHVLGGSCGAQKVFGTSDLLICCLAGLAKHKELLMFSYFSRSGIRPLTGTKLSDHPVTHLPPFPGLEFRV